MIAVSGRHTAPSRSLVSLFALIFALGVGACGGSDEPTVSDDSLGDTTPPKNVDVAAGLEKLAAKGAPIDANHPLEQASEEAREKYVDFVKEQLEKTGALDVGRSMIDAQMEHWERMEVMSPGSVQKFIDEGPKRDSEIERASFESMRITARMYLDYVAKGLEIPDSELLKAREQAKVVTGLSLDAYKSEKPTGGGDEIQETLGTIVDSVINADPGDSRETGERVADAMERLHEAKEPKRSVDASRLDEELVELSQELGSDDRRVKQGARNALRKLGGEGLVRLRALVDSHKVSKPEMRATLKELLKHSPRRTAEDAEDLVELTGEFLASGSKTLAELAYQLCEWLGPAAGQHVPALLEKYEAVSDDAMGLMAGTGVEMALGGVGPAAAAAVPRMIRRLLADENPLPKLQADPLVGIGGPAVAALEALEGDDRTRAAKAVAEAISNKLDDRPKSADEIDTSLEVPAEWAPFLSKLLENEDAAVAGLAASALAGMGRTDDATLIALGRGLGAATDLLARTTLTKTLKRLGPQAAAALPALIAALNDEGLDTLHRVSVITVINRMGAAASDAIPALEALLEVEKEPAVRGIAFSALKKIRKAKDGSTKR